MSKKFEDLSPEQQITLKKAGRKMVICGLMIGVNFGAMIFVSNLILVMANQLFFQSDLVLISSCVVADVILLNMMRISARHNAEEFKTTVNQILGEEQLMNRKSYGYSKLTGLKFGLWTVLNDGIVVNKNRKVPAECECGSKKDIYFQNLVKGVSLSCGCVTREESRQRLIANPIAITLPYGEAARNSLISSYRNLARKRGYRWELTDEEFFVLTKGNCFYCGNEPSYIQKTQYKTGTYIYNGVDRKNNNEGYISENVVSCCRICNVAKGSMNVEEFIKWVQKVSNRIGK